MVSGVHRISNVMRDTGIESSPIILIKITPMGGCETVGDKDSIDKNPKRIGIVEIPPKKKNQHPRSRQFCLEKRRQRERNRQSYWVEGRVTWEVRCANPKRPRIWTMISLPHHREGGRKKNEVLKDGSRGGDLRTPGAVTKTECGGRNARSSVI